MARAYHHAWRTGERVFVRGGVWRLLERSIYKDCESVRLRPAVPAGGPPRTLLLPFDRPRPLRDVNPFRVVRPRACLHRLREIGETLKPMGGLSAAAATSIAILPYQLEPALLMRRDGVARVMIADAVGLGKTIQAGLLLAELAAEQHGLRALVIVPAGLREQWTRELATHFALDAVAASSPWLARTALELPADMNPWALPGIYVASSDLIKRPEVLRPLEDLTWDAVIVDEAHQASLGTARRAAVHAVACRARRVVLLTATPHAGDVSEFAALCRIGAPAPASPAIVLFRRSPANLAPRAQRRTALLAVRLSAPERRMHRLLETYTVRLCTEARARSDTRARLVAIVLRKRALSSAASLAASCRRRLALLDRSTGAMDERQLRLPLGDEDPLPDAEPDGLLAAPGLSDAIDERRLLEHIAMAAHRASADESKIRFLRRLLARIDEPALIFTEYRDTLDRLRRALSPLRPDIQVLHGGLDLRERAAAQREFNSRSSLLLATDAASDGLNLHSRCRLVIHFELPWSPARLEQRTGRVDRIGQRRRVHEVLLLADDTAERLVLAPLVARAARSGAAFPGARALATVLAESQVAASVIDGVQPRAEANPPGSVPFSEPPDSLHEDALEEAARLTDLRRMHRSTSPLPRGGGDPGIVVTRIRARRDWATVPGLFAVYEVTLKGSDGGIVHGQVTVAHCSMAEIPDCKTPAALRFLLNRFLETDDDRVRTRLHRHFAPDLDRVATRIRRCARSMEEREREVLRSQPSASTELVQAGLFDHRAIRSLTARAHVFASRTDDADRRIEALESASRLDPLLRLRAVLVVTAT